MPTAVPAPRVLVVDDEELICKFVERVLRDSGYEVVVAPSGSAALDIVRQQSLFDVFVIDVGMPEMSGTELARQLRQANPDVRVLYFTGDSERLFHEKTSLWEHEAFLDKPVTPTALCQAVSLLLYGHTNGPSQS